MALELTKNTCAFPTFLQQQSAKVERFRGPLTVGRHRSGATSSAAINAWSALSAGWMPKSDAGNL
jgi:hypothetical protein